MDDKTASSGGSSGASPPVYAHLPELYGHSRRVCTLAFNSSGTILATGSVDRTIRIWPMENGKERDVSELRGHTDVIHAVCWDPSNTNRLASASADKTVRLWDVKTGKILHSISTQGEALNIVFSRDGKYIAASNVECISLIDTRKHRVVRRVVNPYEVNEIQFSKSDLLFVAAGHPSGYGTFEIMRIVAEKKGNPNLENVHKVVAHAGSCFALDFHPNGRKVALGGTDSLVSLWDLEELFCEKTFVKTTSTVRLVRFNPSGTLLAIGTDDSHILIVDVDSGETVCSLQLQNPLEHFCWHPNKRNVLAYVGDKPSSDRNANRDGVIKLLEIRDTKTSVP